MFILPVKILNQILAMKQDATIDKFWCSRNLLAPLSVTENVLYKIISSSYMQCILAVRLSIYLILVTLDTFLKSGESYFAFILIN